jgi:hypothetical protein
MHARFFGTMKEEAKVPDSLRSVILSWVVKKFGRRGLIVALVLVALPPAVMFLLTAYRSLTDRELAERRKRIDVLLNGTGVFSVHYFQWFVDGKDPQRTGRVGYRTTLAGSSDPCFFEFTEHRDVETDTIMGRPIQENLKHTDSQATTTSFYAGDIARVEVREFDDRLGARETFSRSIDPLDNRAYVMLANDWAAPVFRVGVDDYTGSSFYAAKGRAEIRLGDVSRANTFATIMLKLSEQCSPVSSVTKDTGSEPKLRLLSLESSK